MKYTKQIQVFLISGCVIFGIAACNSTPRLSPEQKAAQKHAQAISSLNVYEDNRVLIKNIRRDKVHHIWSSDKNVVTAFSFNGQIYNLKDVAKVEQSSYARGNMGKIFLHLKNGVKHDFDLSSENDKPNFLTCNKSKGCRYYFEYVFRSISDEYLENADVARPKTPVGSNGVGPLAWGGLTSARDAVYTSVHPTISDGDVFIIDANADIDAFEQKVNKSLEVRRKRSLKY